MKFQQALAPHHSRQRAKRWRGTKACLSACSQDNSKTTGPICGQGRSKVTKFHSTECLSSWSYLSLTVTKLHNNCVISWTLVLYNITFLTCNLCRMHTLLHLELSRNVEAKLARWQRLVTSRRDWRPWGASCRHQKKHTKGMSSANCWWTRLLMILQEVCNYLSHTCSI